MKLLQYLNQFLSTEHAIRYIGFDMARVSKISVNSEFYFGFLFGLLYLFVSQNSICEIAGVNPCSMLGYFQVSQSGIIFSALVGKGTANVSFSAVHSISLISIVLALV